MVAGDGNGEQTRDGCMTFSECVDRQMTLPWSSKACASLAVEYDRTTGGLFFRRDPVALTGVGVLGGPEQSQTDWQTENAPELGGDVGEARELVLRRLVSITLPKEVRLYSSAS